MTEENKNIQLISEITQRIEKLNSEIDGQKDLLERIYLRAVGDLKGCYIRFNTTFMRVETQFVSGRMLELHGPTITLDTNPIDELEEPEEIMEAEYREHGNVKIDYFTLQGLSADEFSIITVDDFVKVLKIWYDTMKKKFK